MQLGKTRPTSAADDSTFAGTWEQSALSLLPALGTFAAVALLALILRKYVLPFVLRLLFFLGKDEQLIVEKLTDTVVTSGPGIKFVSPFVKSAAKRKAELLDSLDYLRVQDTLTGSVTIVKGPCLHFLNAFDTVLERGLIGTSGRAVGVWRSIVRGLRSAGRWKACARDLYAVFK